jgi:hypothetical protein
VSDIRPSLERMQKRLAGTTSRAAGVVFAVILVLVGFGFAGYFLRNAIVESAVAADALGDPGSVWAVTFLAMVAPGVLLSAACAVYVATFRWWSLVAVVLSLLLVVLAVGASGPPRTNDVDKPEALVVLMLDLGVDGARSVVLFGAFRAGLITLGVLVAFGLTWAAALHYQRPSLPGRPSFPAAYIFIARSFRWVYPVIVALGVPILTILGAASAS